MDSVDELAALGRIIVCIQEYRRLSTDYTLVDNAFLEKHLKICLIAADYLFWQYVRDSEQTKLNAPALDLVNDSSFIAFKLLLSQYRRSVYENLYWHWDKPGDD